MIATREAKDRAFVATRIGVDRDMAYGTVHKMFDRAALTKLASVSLKRLRTDCVGALVLHNPLVSTLARRRGPSARSRRSRKPASADSWASASGR